jgi:hypothetical protein
MHESREKINPYEVEDMRRVLQTQTRALHNLQNTNAVLVAENSKLRMHLSLMPVQYRDFAAKMQASNHQAYYLAQRTDPQLCNYQTEIWVLRQLTFLLQQQDMHQELFHLQYQLRPA